MRVTGLALAAGLALCLMMPLPAAAQGGRAVDTCARAALQQAMLLMSVESQTALHDRRGAVVGTKVDMRVNALGKKVVVSCFYTDATRSAEIRPFQQRNGGGAAVGPPANLTALRREALRACQRASQEQGLMLDNVVAQNDLLDRRGQVRGSEVILDVFQRGRPARVTCDYDFGSKGTALQLSRATLR